MAKIKITLSKGPQGVQGPQGPQGPLGPAGPQGIQGQPGVDGTIIDNINDIDNVGLDLNTANLLGTNIEGLGLLSPRSNRYLTWDPVDNIIKLSEDTPGTYVITGASGSPSPGNQFVNPIFASTNGGNVPNVFAASGVISVNQSSQIPSSVNLYVNGNARFNGAIQVGDVNGVSYSLPSADGTAGQLLQTDGAGSVSFVSFSGSPWTTTGSDIYYNTGNVGIGTATPAHPLDVNGRANATNFNGVVLANNGTGRLIVGDGSTASPSVYATSVGMAAGLNSNGNYNSFIGYYSGVNANGNGNTAVGTQSGVGWQSSTNSRTFNSSVGMSAGYGPGHFNAHIGAYSGPSATVTSSNNAAVGYYAGRIAGDDNVSLGYYSNQGAAKSYSVAAGSESNRYTSGSNNVAIGHQAGLGVSAVSTFANTVAVGYQALTALTTGAGNTAVGYQANVTQTTGSNNTTLGYQANAGGVSTSNSVAIGHNAIASNNRSIAIGKDAYAPTYDVIAIGNEAGPHGGGNPSASVWIGRLAGYNNGGNGNGYNVGIGHQAGRLSNSQYNVYLGNSTGYHGSQGFNTWVGAGSGSTSGNTSVVTQSVAVGYQASSGNAVGGVAVGYQAGNGSATADYTVAVGYEALTALTTGTSNTAVGYQAGAALTTAGSNTFFGYQAGYQSSHASATGNTFIGSGAGGSLTTGAYSGIVAVGSGAGNNPNTRSVHIGQNSGQNNNGFGTINIGFGAGGFSTSASSVSVGYQANYASGTANKVGIGYGANAGANSVAIGYQAGESTGSGNIFIGYQAGDGETGSNKLFIENSNSTTPLIYGEFDNDILRVNGTLQVNDPASTGYAFPTATGTLGQALVVNASGDVEFGDISSFTELSSVNYWFPDGKFHDTDDDGQSNPLGLYFKSDGTKMYVVGGGSDDVNEYSLSTAWDPSTATFTEDQYLSPTPSSCYISPDGSKFFWADSGNKRVYVATMDTAWDVSDASWTNFYNNNDSWYTGGYSPLSLYFKPDGTKMYVGTNSGDAIHEYNLTTAWDLTTVSASVANYGIDDVNVNSEPRGLTISDDGLKMYVVDHLEYIQEFEFSTAWDLSTLTFIGYQELGEPDTEYEDIYYNETNSDYAFIVGNSNNRIYRFDTKAIEPSSDGTFTSDVAFIPKIYSNSISSASASFSGRITTGNNSTLGGQTNLGSINASHLYAANGYFNVRGGTRQGILFATTHGSSSGVILKPSADYLEGPQKTLLIPSVDATIKTTAELYYLDRYDSNSEAKVTGATEDIEYYYTARADGQGKFQRQLGALPASGQTLTRTSYYSNKAFADPDTASDWTVGTAYTSTSLASSISQSTDTLLNVQATGIPPLSTKIVISNHLGSSGFLSGDANGFGGTSVVYSLRLLNNLYEGAAIRVVNDSDVEADIGFTSSYELDTSALLTHCGSGDGYLVKWYDQAKGGNTGDGNDATWESSTSYSSRKPQIVSAGSVITDNGKPCLETIDAGMVMDEQFSASAEYDLFFVAQKTTNNNNHGMIWGTQTGNDCRVWLYDYRIYLEVNAGENNQGGYGDGGANTSFYNMGQLILNVRRDGSSVNTAQRNDVVGDHNYTRSGAMKTDRILNAWSNQQYSFGGNVQEIIMLDGDKSSERSAILSNLNTYYSVY